MNKVNFSFLRPRGVRALAASVVLVVVAGAQAQLLTVPNSSFEMQPGDPMFFGVNINIDSWQKAGKPGYFPAGGSNGVFWVQTAGVFAAPAYGNQVGSQAAYLLSYKGAGLFQDFDTRDWNDALPTHEFNALYEVGKSYKLTLGVFGKLMVENQSALELSLYYRDGFNAIQTIGATTILYSAATFNPGGPFNLIDFEVNVPTVLPTDDWAGQNIGIKIAAAEGDGNGYWDMDNLRLEAVPEPATWSLLAVGTLGVWLARRRVRAQS